MRITGVDILDWLDKYRLTEPDEVVHFDLDACLERTGHEGRVIVVEDSDYIPKAHEIADLGEELVREYFKRFEAEDNLLEVVYKVSDCSSVYDMMTIYLSCLADLHKKDFSYMITYIFENVDDYYYFCRVINCIRDMINVKNCFLWIRLIAEKDTGQGDWEGY